MVRRFKKMCKVFSKWRANPNQITIKVGIILKMIKMKKRVKIPKNIDEKEYIKFWVKTIFENIENGIYIEDECEPYLISKSFKDTNMIRITEFKIISFNKHEYIEANKHVDYFYNDVETLIKEWLLNFNGAIVDCYLIVEE